jgi:hypothetical protein
VNTVMNLQVPFVRKFLSRCVTAVVSALSSDSVGDRCAQYKLFGACQLPSFSRKKKKTYL